MDIDPYLQLFLRNQMNPPDKEENDKIIWTEMPITNSILIETIIHDWRTFAMNVYESDDKCDRILFSVYFWNPFKR